ncbi:MAG: hypothetical protein ACE5G7_07000, partial [Candidatus Hydrothermarchaeaceae archaeon]
SDAQRRHPLHLAPVCFVKNLGNDELLIACVFISKIASNVKNGSKMALGTSLRRDGYDGYLLKGTGEVISESELFEDFKKEITERTSGKRVPRGVILFTAEEAYSLKPFRGKKRIC